MAQPETQFVDIIEGSVGQFGIWQLWISAIIIFGKLPSALYQGSIVYIAPHTEYTCLDPVVKDPGKVCEIDCHEYEFKRDLFKETIVTEFLLVCDKKYLGAMAHTIFMIGNGLGNMASGVLSDKYGRKKIVLGYIVLHFLAVIGTIVSPNLICFYILRFITGFGTGGLGLGFVILLEIVSGKYREVVSCLFLLTFPVGLITLAILAYFNRYWRRLYSILAIISFIIVILTFFLPESPRYLLANKKIDKCIKILERGAKQNNLPTEKIRENVELSATKTEDTQQQRRGSLSLIVGYKPLRLRIFICAYIFFTAGVNYFGILIYLGRLDHNIFVSNIFGAMTGIPGLFVCMVLTKYCHRKTILMLSSVVIICGLLAIIKFGKSQLSVMAASFSLFGVSVLVPTMTIFIGEYFPTTVRSTAVGISFSLSNFGSALSSLPPHLADYVFWAPPLLFAILQAIGLLFLIFIPETKGKPLPENINDLVVLENKRNKQEEIMKDASSSK